MVVTGEEWYQHVNTYNLMYTAIVDSDVMSQSVRVLLEYHTLQHEHTVQVCHWCCTPQDFRMRKSSFRRQRRMVIFHMLPQFTMLVRKRLLEHFQVVVERTVIVRVDGSSQVRVLA